MVKQAKPYDLELVASLAAQLWDSHTPNDLKEEFSELIQSKNACFFLKYDTYNPHFRAAISGSRIAARISFRQVKKIYDFPSLNTKHYRITNNE